MFARGKFGARRGVWQRCFSRLCFSLGASLLRHKISVIGSTVGTTSWQFAIFVGIAVFGRELEEEEELLQLITTTIHCTHTPLNKEAAINP